MNSNFFLFDESKVYDTVQTIKRAFNDSNNNFLLGYSLKANYDSHLIEVLNEENILFDCASDKELSILLEKDIDPKKITVSSPYLTKELIDKCFLSGVFIYADSFNQLTLLNKCAISFGKKIDVGIRLNLNEYSYSRFGIELNKFNIQKVHNIFDKTSFLKMKGLHSHYSPSNRSTENFEKRLDVFFGLINKYFNKSNLSLINLGGGFSGAMSQRLASQFNYEIPSWEDYGRAYEKMRLKHNIENYKIVIEPGMGIAANAFSYVAEVVDIKKFQDKNIVVLNTSTLFLKPTGHSKNLDFEIKTHSSKLEETFTYNLVGISCMEKDVLGVYEGFLEIGSKIIFKNVGAYTLSFRENFIFDQPKVLLKNNSF